MTGSAVLPIYSRQQSTAGEEEEEEEEEETLAVQFALEALLSLEFQASQLVKGVQRIAVALVLGAAASAQKDEGRAGQRDSGKNNSHGYHTLWPL